MKFDLFVSIPAIREENDGFLYVCVQENDFYASSLLHLHPVLVLS